MDTYTEALDLLFDGPNGNCIQAVSVEDEQEGKITLIVDPFWAPDTQVMRVTLTVPLVTPVPYKGDDGIFGHIIRLPRSRTSRFCHPLLICPFAESIAKDRKKGPARLRFSKPTDWDFEWINFYGRVRRAIEQALEKMMKSQQQPTTGFVHMHFRRAISNLIAAQDDQVRPAGWAENGSTGGDVCTGIPITDECLIYRQMHEVRLGFPDVLSNNYLYEQIKMRFVAHVDSFCDICWTGKNHCAREVGRVFEGDPKSFITNRPMPGLLRGMNPLAQIASPARVWREDRSCSGWLTFAEPIEPPLKAKGVSLPKPFTQRITTLMTALVDISGFNVFSPGDEVTNVLGARVKDHEEISLDGLLVTKSGRKKLKARVTTSDLLTADEFLPRMEHLQELPGFQFEEDPIEVEGLTDGTTVYSYMYRYWWDQDLRCRFDKVKCLCGGIKGVTRPISQLYTEIRGEVVPIDMVISERTALSKGGVDLWVYTGLANAGVKEIDPAWSKEELIDMATQGLKEQGLPESGRFPIYSSQQVPMVNGKIIAMETASTLEALGQHVWWKVVKVLIGEGTVGPLPFCRAQETEHRQSSAKQGLSLNVHARVLGGVPLPLDEKTQTNVEKTARFFYDYSPLASQHLIGSGAEDF